jgi:hypothetical protein
MLSLAQLLLAEKSDLPTQLTSAELRNLGADVLRQSLFSARMSNAAAVQALRTAINNILSRTDGLSADNLAEARLKMKQLGHLLGYDPESGFPGEKAEPAEAGSLRDIFSTDRLNLIFKTQQMMTQGAAKNIWGNEPDALEQYPAWELTRVASVEIPRGEKKVKGGVESDPENAWDSAHGRWQAALDETGDEDAQKIFDDTGRMIARKDSPMWQALGDGAGGYDDTLGNDYEPYAFNSGMGRVEISAKEFEELGGDARGTEATDTEFGPDEVKLPADRFDADILQTFVKAMETGDIKYRVKVEVTK